MTGSNTLNARKAIEAYFRGRGYASSTWGRQIDLVRDGGVEDAAAMIVKVAVAAGLVDPDNSDDPTNKVVDIRRGDV